MEILQGIQSLDTTIWWSGSQNYLVKGGIDTVYYEDHQGVWKSYTCHLWKRKRLLSINKWKLKYN